MKKKILLVLVVLLIGIQFFRPAKNDSNAQPNPISGKYLVTDEVASILKVACNDCHSNKTEYPWYSNVQPVAWWLDHHVTEGKRHVNFSDFTSQRIAFQYHHFEDFVEQLEKKEMPIPSYTWLGLHAGANLSEAQSKTLISWAKAQMKMLKEQFPADSLIMPRRPGPPRE
jgi:Haem-binding domain